MLRFDNPFDDEIYDGNVPLSFTFRNRILPEANLMIRGISIQTFVTIEKVDFLIDEFVSTTLDFFAPKQQLFLASTVSSGSDEVYTATDFTVTQTLANKVPFGGIILVYIPPQIEVGDAADVVTSCKASENLMATLSCELVTEADGWHLLTVRDAFPLAGLAKDQVFDLTIGSGMYTPLSMKTSDSFKVIITDSENHEINYVLTALSLTMK